jgi:hypothetical protein
MKIDLSKPVELPTEPSSHVNYRTELAVLKYERHPHPLEAVKKARFRFNPKMHERQARVLVANGWMIEDGVMDEIYAAHYVGLDLAVAAATTHVESGGKNIYGGDPASSWMNHGPFGELWEHEVTKENFAWFWREDQNPQVTSNGVGRKQLTSKSLIVAANARGGAWLNEHNAAEGDLYMKELINQSRGSLWTAAYHYNGSGPDAVRYANDYVSLVTDIRSELAHA